MFKPPREPMNFYMFPFEKGKTPLELAMLRMKYASICGFILSGVNLVFMFFDFIVITDIYTVIEIALVATLSLLLLITKSRIASVLLLVIYISSRIIIYIENPASGSPSFMAIAVVAIYWCGILGSFSYHKIKRQEKAEQRA